MTAGLDQGKRLEKIELIDTLLEYASDIVTEMKPAKGSPDDAREKELLSLLFQILSLLFQSGAGTIPGTLTTGPRLACEKTIR